MQPWWRAGCDNVVYRDGDEVLKADVALVLDTLKWLPDEAMAACETQRAEAQDADAELREAFGDIPLPVTAMVEQWDFPGPLLQKFDTDSRWNFDPEQIYRNRPVLVRQQPFFSPATPDFSQAIGLHIGKAEFFHRQRADADVYRRVGQQLLLREVEGFSELDMPSVYQVVRNVSTFEYITQARQDAGFRDVLADFVLRAARYTHATGRLVDVVPTLPNTFLVQDAATHEWRARSYELHFPKSFEAVNVDMLRRNFLTDPTTLTDPESVGWMTATMNYMRTFNLLALACEEEPPFDIRFPHGDPNTESDSSVQPDRWAEMYAATMQALEQLGGAKVRSAAETAAEKYRYGQPHEVSYQEVLAAHGINPDE